MRSNMMTGNKIKALDIIKHSLNRYTKDHAAALIIVILLVLAEAFRDSPAVAVLTGAFFYGIILYIAYQESANDIKDKE
jgi:hypothetical protein